MHKLVAALRGYTGAGVGLIITLACGLYALTLGSIWHTFFPSRPNIARFTAARWAWLLDYISYRGIMGLRVEFDPIPQLDPHSVTILYGTHLPLEMMPYLARVAGLVTPDMKVVAKKEILDGAFGLTVGRPAHAADLFVLINREVRHEALGAIASAIEKIPPGTVIIILPDRHRPTQKYLDDDRKKDGAKYPEMLAWETCLPHSGGLLTLLRGFDSIGRSVQLLRFGAGFDRKMKDGCELSKLTGNTLHFWVHQVDAASFPRESADANERLRLEWQEYHDRLADWRLKLLN